MNNGKIRSGTGIDIVRWIARLLSLIIVFVNIFSLIEDTWNAYANGTSLSTINAVDFMQGFAFYSSSIGLLIAWLWELLGALTNIAGAELFLIFLWMKEHSEADFFY
jgi:hypothetical protein